MPNIYPVLVDLIRDLFIFPAAEGLEVASLPTPERSTGLAPQDDAGLQEDTQSSDFIPRGHDESPTSAQSPYDHPTGAGQLGPDEVVAVLQHDLALKDSII